MCKQILDPSYLHRLCDAPISELSVSTNKGGEVLRLLLTSVFQMKQNNKIINGERDKQNQAGRRILKKDLTDEIYATLPDKPVTDDDEEREGRKANSRTVVKTPARNKNAARSRTVSSSQTRASTSTKRKKPSLSSFSDDEFDDGDEDYHPSAFGTSARRLTRKSAAVVSSSPTPRAGSVDDEIPETAKAVRLPGRRYPRRSFNQARKPSMGRRNAKSLVSTSSSNREPSLGTSADRHLTLSSYTDPSPIDAAISCSTTSIKSDPFPEYSDLVSKQIICRLLNIQLDFAIQYSLLELQTYARGYNQAFGEEPWVPEGFPQCVGHRHFMWDGRNSYEHFAQCLTHLMDLAIARQDLNPDGTCVVNAPYEAGFNTGGDPIQDNALGVAVSNHGLQPQFQPHYNGQSDAQFHSQFDTRFESQSGSQFASQFDSQLPSSLDMLNSEYDPRLGSPFNAQVRCSTPLTPQGFKSEPHRQTSQFSPFK